MRLGDDLPRANPEFTRLAFSSYEERRAFAEEVGLIGDTDDAPESGLSDLAARMGQVGAPAELIEELDPANLAAEPSISQVRKGGIYNRATIVLGERSKYTQGLEAELEKIRDRVTDEELEASALSVLFAPVSTGDNRRHDPDPEQLVEAVPLNDEQRRAAGSAFSEKLTVVTGPPGTGKSQVVLTVLANAYLRGHSALFTSRNHKAVNVVEDRLNALAGFPLVIRTGKRSGDRDLYAELLAFINQLLSITPNDADIAEEQSLRRRLAKLVTCETETWEKLSALRRLRNEMDSLDLELQEHREEYPISTWLAVCDGTLNSQLANVPDPDELRSLVGRHLRPTGPLETVRCWLSRARTYRRLTESANQFRQFQEAIGPPPPGETGAESLPVFAEYFLRASDLKAVSQMGAQYRQALVELRAAGSVEALADELAAIHDKAWTTGARLLAAYSKLLPNRITPDMRKTLGQYRALLERLNGDNVRGFPYLNLLQEQRRLFQQVTDVLPTWCVTNLSAKSSLPFAAGMFDLLVIDEASQCDIPSAIPLLFRSKRAVIIGDPQQLRHVTTIDKARDNQLQSKHGLISAEDVAFAFSINSLYDLASMSVGGGQVVPLLEHFRSHADIIEFSSRQWYASTLRVCTDYRRLKLPRGHVPGIEWTQVRGEVKKPQSGGALCIAECDAVVTCTKKLLEDESFTGTVGVVTPFRAQANRIKDKLFECFDYATIEKAGLIVDTAHGFQGDERDVIVFSPCVGQRMPGGAKCFLSSTGNLFNVAVSRARSVLHVVGDREACAECGVPHIEAFARYFGDLEARLGVAAVASVDESTIGPGEPALIEELVRLGLHPMPQYLANQYRLDIAVVEGDVRIDVEVDGELYHTDWDGARSRADLIRDLRLTSLGWTVLRFWAQEVRDDLGGCTDRVTRLLESLGRTRSV